jgi:hypothetical protein
MKGKTFWILLLAFLAGGGFSHGRHGSASFYRGSLQGMGVSNRSRWTWRPKSRAASRRSSFLRL